ncbi:hypothetical protein BDZ89DRAFT_1060472 [Hymenopellis radicata]|nr:hypothetical protein BDZ89DRAFT_1060472 [Hymenopellis radicata]
MAVVSPFRSAFITALLTILFQRGNGSRSSLTIDELRWLSACSAFADAPSSPRSPSSPIPIVSCRLCVHSDIFTPIF